MIQRLENIGLRDTDYSLNLMMELKWIEVHEFTVSETIKLSKFLFDVYADILIGA